MTHHRKSRSSAGYEVWGQMTMPASVGALRRQFERDHEKDRLQRIDKLLPTEYKTTSARNKAGRRSRGMSGRSEHDVLRDLACYLAALRNNATAPSGAGGTASRSILKRENATARARMRAGRRDACSSAWRCRDKRRRARQSALDASPVSCYEMHKRYCCCRSKGF